MSSENNADKILLISSSLFDNKFNKEEDQAITDWQINNDDKLYDDSDTQNSASEYNAKNHYLVTSEL